MTMMGIIEGDILDANKCIRLVASGMDVNMADGRGNTALHYAATNNRFDVVKVWGGERERG